MSHWLDAPLTVLGLVMLVLLVVEWTVDLSPEWAQRATTLQTAIWAVFVLTFVVELTLAPKKLRYLRTHWLTAVGVILPAFRAIRIFRLARAVRGLSLVRLTTTLNRASRAAGSIASRGEVGYVMLITAIVTSAAAAGVYFFERGIPTASIQTPWDAAWWAMTIVTTINSPLEAVTLEGRVVALALRIFALAFSGYITAMIAVHLLGAAQPEQDELRARLERIEQLLEQKVERSAARRLSERESIPSEPRPFGTRASDEE